MCVVNLFRISPSFNNSTLREVVGDISRKINCLLEIVNFNVDVCQFFFCSRSYFSPGGRFQGQQYVCAGELVALQTMPNVLDYLKIQKVNLAKVSRSSLRDVD